MASKGHFNGNISLHGQFDLHSGQGVYYGHNLPQGSQNC